MKEQEIIEGNKLIAEFMEYKHSDILYDEENEEYFFDTDHLVCVEDIEVWESSVDDWTSTLSPEQMLFHSSWDWLMPVVEKIEKNFWVTTTTRRGYSAVSIHQPQRAYEKIARVDSENKLEATWTAIVEFIKWYNSCQKEK